MRALVVLVLMLLASLMTAGQANPSDKPATASLSGTIVKDPGGEPLKKAILELIQESSGSGHNYTATSDSDGHFEIHDITPGRYHLFVERTGFLSVDAKHHKSFGLALTFDRGQDVQDLVVHMLPCAIVTGRVLDEDGDPMPGANVTLLRRHASGSNKLNQVVAERTNDLGQYRLSGVVPGRYLLAVTPPATFESVLAPKEKDPGDNPEFSYVTTYYPNTTDRAQASPVELRAGDELPLDFSLTRAPTARIRGNVANLPAGTVATVVLHAADGDLTFSEVETGKDGKFEFRNVQSGSYTLMALASLSDKSMVARQTQTVNGTNIDNVRLGLLPETTVRGRVHVPENPAFDLSQIGLTLRMLDAEGETLQVFLRAGDDSRIRSDGSIEWKDVAAGSYYLDAIATSDAANDYFIESITAGGRDVRDSGFAVAGSLVSLDIVLSPKGARIDGTVLDDHDHPVPNAVVVAAPGEKLRKRPDRFERTVSDQHGHFTMRGMIPGDYSLFAWEALEQRDLADPESLKPYQDHAAAVHLEKAVQARVSVKVQPSPED